MRLDRGFDCVCKILFAYWNDVFCLTKENLQFVLSRFIFKVLKSHEEGDYLGKTLYKIVCAIQNYLRKHDIDWKLVHGTEFVLWEHNILGEENPEKLRNTVLYFLSVNCALRAGDEHYRLRCPGGCTPSQISI